MTAAGASLPDSFPFDQLRIDVARNATDDFNPFHDPARWTLVDGNPFPGPIALGFQLEALAVAEVERVHQAAGETADYDAAELPFESVQFGFVNAVAAGEAVEVQVRSSKRDLEGKGEVSNRIVMRKAGSRDVVLIGSRRLGRSPMLPMDADLPSYAELSEQPDRQRTRDGRFFLKRKFLTTSNGKNFCVASWIDQRRYFDELADLVCFPGMFVASLCSCALLEMAWAGGHDFMAEPLVYTGHRISIDRRLQRALRSNQPVQLLAGEETGGEADADDGRRRFQCLGVIEPGELLFRAELELASLSTVIDAAAR